MDHDLSAQEVENLNAIIAQYNLLHPNDRQTLVTHAKNNNHATVVDWVKGTAKYLGLPIAGMRLVTIGLYFAKRLGKK